ncbi:RING finger protein 37 [Daktulosphaira vitifoliae]|uniref:RING finger protein 37 n=1 Tax=Daktulosphaira vitifoliae TaxID=58002 RepID=UPI0021A9ABFC|nr:RING finger protein 37 [Daktulosphaira vitifoliae]
MLLNVCDPIFNSKIQLDGSCISHEDYSVENLISSDIQLQKKGFLCETFIRPPVSLTITFPYTFDIKSVIINTRVGGQKSTGIQLMSNRKDSLLSICSKITDKDLLVFHDIKTDLSSYGNNCDFCCFNISASRLLRSTKKLTLRIFKTANSIPAIGKLEIWGIFSTSVPTNIKQELIKKWETCKIIQTPNKLLTQSNLVLSCRSEKNVEHFSIPEDFLDSITYEVMMYPMVLPSGKYVDQSTIDKCIQNDIMFGRKPSDPFTGIPFSDILKPKPVPELKGRMDAFILKHSDEEIIKSLPRILGKHSINFYTERCTKFPKVQCSKCHNEEYLYHLLCQHILCKNCLQEKIECNVCCKIFDKSQIKKYNFQP